MTNNEKLALARACGLEPYIKTWEGDTDPTITYEVKNAFMDYECEFTPETDANQCHECWDKLVTPKDVFWVMEYTPGACSCRIAIPVESVDFKVMDSPILSTMTAAMVQLPAVQKLLKEIEG